MTVDIFWPKGIVKPMGMRKTMGNLRAWPGKPTRRESYTTTKLRDDFVRDNSAVKLLTKLRRLHGSDDEEFTLAEKIGN
jgi:hypothetical protein